jgi:3-methylcrotonyl-CoA carboxylase alpha subunit
MGTLLVANRGEIARRIVRTARSLGWSTVAVYSDADARARHVAEADRAVRIGPGPAAASYLRIDAVLDAAARTGATAIHPGYGFLSENAAFAEAVEAAGLIWVGPPASAIRAVGDKAAAKALATACGVPTAAGRWGLDDPAALAEAAAALGYPVLLKATAGGGGRGMRRVDHPDALAEAIASARREAEAAFGSGALLVERYLERARHIEVQIAADQVGGVVHLYERECSVQRRHQKVFEEAPSPAVTPALRDALGAASIALARAAGYVGVGTCEFLLEPDGRFAFLEMNTRLQVEHPVTEAITGIDLVAWQLQIALGEPLPLRQAEIPLRGHAIEARLYAEDPMRDYAGAAGAIRVLDLPADAGVRVDAGYASGDTVSVHYDAMVAKVIAHGPTRAVANQRLTRALDRAWLVGLPNNLPLLRQVVRHPLWRAADLDTHFLARAGLPAPPPLHPTAGVLAATALARQLDAAPQPGFRLGGPSWQEDRWRCGDTVYPVRWRRSPALEIALEGVTHAVEVFGWDGQSLDLAVDGLRQRVRACWTGPADAVADGETVYLHGGDWESMVRLEPRFPAPLAAETPGTCAAPTPGTVVQVAVAVGDRVRQGDLLVTLEAMKMEHRTTAPWDGVVVHVAVVAGEGVAAGALLARVEPDPT